MTQYVNVPIETDPNELAQDAFGYIQALVPGWQPSDGNLDVRIIMAIAQLAADSRDIASDVPTTIFRYFGTSLLNLPALDGSPAVLSLTFTARDNAGYTIPDGTVIQGTDNAGNTTFWQTVGDAIIPPSSTSIAGVVTESQLPGTVYNAITFSSGQLVLVDGLSFISTIVAVGASSGGIDAEDDPTYLNRLTGDLTLLAPRPIIPSDFAQLALNFPGVARALAVDGYDLVANTSNNARTITIYVTDIDGGAPPSPTLDAIDASLQAQREVNFNIYVTGPYVDTSTSVIWAASLTPGFVAADVETAVNDNIRAFLDASNWGNTSDGVDTVWRNQQWIRLSAVSAVIQDTPGIDHVGTITIDGSPADHDMTAGGANGPVAVPQVLPTGVVTGVAS